MAEPVWANITEQYSFVVNMLDEIELWCQTASVGIVATVEAARNDIQGSWASAAVDGISANRAQIAALLAPANIQRLLTPLLRQMANTVDVGSPNSDSLNSIRESVYDYMIANSLSVDSRNFNWGSWAADAGNTGDGLFLQLTDDEQGQDLEGVFPDALTLECDLDARGTGAEHTEIFRCFGTARALDGCAMAGYGELERVESLNANHSTQYILNPSFNTASPAPVTGTPATPTSLQGWTDNTGTYDDVVIDFDTTYRAQPNVATNYSLEFTDDSYIYQDLLDENNSQLDPDTPYLIGVAMYREGSATGTLTIRVTDSDAPTTGGVSRDITIGGQTNATWARYWLVATPGANNWFLNLNSNDICLSFQVASLATGTIFIDDVIFAPWTRIARGLDTKNGRGAMGTYVAVCGGPIPFVKGDFALRTIAENSGTRCGDVQWLTARGHLGYYPHHNAGSETWADK